MAAVEVVMPKMGESISDATIIKWFKKEGEKINDEETLLEVATDKVDSEIPSPVAGIVQKILYDEEAVVDVGEVIAIIETKEKSTKEKTSKTEKKKPFPPETKEAKLVKKEKPTPKVEEASEPTPDQEDSKTSAPRFYSPLVKNIAAQEKISQEELRNISGSGAGGRVTKKDILQYIQQGKAVPHQSIPSYEPTSETKSIATNSLSSTEINDKGEEIIEMDRMRKLIAEHMVQSKRISPHVTSFAEADVTRLFEWRNRVKDDFTTKYGVKLTITHIVVELVAKALQQHPRINSSMDGSKMIIKKNINIGMATALPSGNLIVPVIHNADQYNLNGIAINMNEKVNKARTNTLDVADIQNGTFTLTNIGSYGSQLGTPIINQPQVAILATGAIKKKPVVIESADGDAIGIRQMMYLSMSYDHRIIDGYLGGTFLQTVISLLENFDDTREI